jgi:hypothetical protein
MPPARWRAPVKTADTGRVTHESTFHIKTNARAYVDALRVAGSWRVLAVRQAGEARFYTVHALRMGGAS